jgi:hypothetical protein
MLEDVAHHRISTHKISMPRGAAAAAEATSDFEVLPRHRQATDCSAGTR